MADRQFVIQGVEAAPADWVVPDILTIVPKTAYATFDGTGAASAYLPVLEILSDSGHVVAICRTQDTVAAGASAIVSWFPGGELDTSSSTPAGITSVGSSTGTLSVSSPTGPAVSVDLPVQALTPGSYGDASDSVTITVDAEGRITAVSQSAIVGGGAVVGSDGWVNDTAEVWTFASFTAGPPAAGTFTVPGDLRSKYTVGTRIKLVQTTTKYFVVSTDPTFGGGVTTVTISGGTDYTLANAAISGNYHSYVLNPQGYPTWFNYAPGAAGWSAPTVNVARFAVEGRTCLVNVDIQGTSNATTATAVAPIAGGANSSESGVAMLVTENNTVIATTPGRAVVGASSTTMTFNSNMAGAGWTNSGTKRATCQMAYEI